MQTALSWTNQNLISPLTFRAWFQTSPCQWKIFISFRVTEHVKAENTIVEKYCFILGLGPCIHSVQMIPLAWTKVSLIALKIHPCSSYPQIILLWDLWDQEMPCVVLFTWCWPDDVLVSQLIGTCLSLHFM